MHFGHAERDITPGAGLELSGYGYFLGRRAQATLDPLMARAVAIRDSVGTAAVIVQLDLLALDADFVERVRRQTLRRFRLGPESVLLHCTHTHSAPAVRRLFGCGDIDDAYGRWLCGAVVECIGDALSRLEPALGVHRFGGVHYGGFAHNRADGAAPDTEVRGVVARFSGAAPLALISFACHPVALGRNLAYSADYCGAVLRACAARGLRALFLNGCCGDISPAEQGISEARLLAAGTAFAEVVGRGIGRATPWRPGPLRFGTRRLALDTDPAIDAAEPWAETSAGDAPAQVARLSRDHLTTLARAGRAASASEVEVQTLSFGDVAVIGMGAEVFSAHGAVMRAAFPDHLLLLAGTSNAVAGYVPNRADAVRGGYASTRGRHIYGLPVLRPGAGERFAVDSAAAVAAVVSA